MIRVPLSKGYIAIVDDEDAWVLRFRWHASEKHRVDGTKVIYARADVDGKKVGLHGLLLGSVEGFFVDHRDGDGLNCRRGNLRQASKSQNGGNRRKRGDCNYRYKGISKLPNRKSLWRADICINGKGTYLGCFKSDTEAAIAYNRAAAHHFGEFARLNEIAA